MDKNIVVIYHKDCFDGFGSAWAAWKKFKNKAEYIAASFNEQPIENVKNKEVYFIDFVYKKEILEKFIAENKKVTAIDHHITREKETKMTADYSYSLDNSGSVLAWKYFHPEKPVPMLLRHIEDVDLWKFKIKGSKEINAVLELFNFDFKVWDKLAKNLENPKKKEAYLEKGELILKNDDKLIKEIIKSGAVIVEFEGYKTLAVNSPKFSSEIGHLLVKKMPPIGIVWCYKEDKIVVSLRSDGTADVAKLAERFGGGGHKAASGFSFSASVPVPWKEISKYES